MNGEVLGSSRCDANLLPWLPSSASWATGCFPGLRNRRTFRWPALPMTLLARRRSGVAGYGGAARRVRRVRRTGRASRGGEVRGTRRRGAGRLAGQALRAARLLPGRGPSAAGCRGPGPVPRPAARGAAAPGRRGGRRGQRGPGGPVAGHAPVAGARAVVAAAGRAARRGPPLLRRRPRRDPVVARVVAPVASPRPRPSLVWSRR